MTDDLLDEATRLAAEFNRQFPITANTLRALVERVQQAEADADGESNQADYWVGELERVERERDAARGKLDKVRQWSDNNLGGAQNAALLAILDGEGGVMSALYEVRHIDGDISWDGFTGVRSYVWKPDRCVGTQQYGALLSLCSEGRGVRTTVVNTNVTPDQARRTLRQMGHEIDNPGGA